MQLLEIRTVAVEQRDMTVYKVGMGNWAAVASAEEDHTPAVAVEGPRMAVEGVPTVEGVSAMRQVAVSAGAVTPVGLAMVGDGTGGGGALQGAAMEIGATIGKSGTPEEVRVDMNTPPARVMLLEKSVPGLLRTTRT